MSASAPTRQRPPIVARAIGGRRPLARLPLEWCDRHGGYVDEGRTRRYIVREGSERICDGCFDERPFRLTSRSH